jgi:hypothetical protein
VDVRILLGQIVGIIIQKTMEIMEEVPVMMIHLHHHHHHHHRGLVVAIREVVEDHLEIECDLMMIGTNHNCKENLLLDLNEKY